MVPRLYDHSAPVFIRSGVRTINTHGDKAQLKEAIATSPLSRLSRLAPLFSLVVVCARHDNGIRILHRGRARDRGVGMETLAGESIITKITFISSVLQQWVMLPRARRREPRIILFVTEDVVVRKLPASG